MRLHFCVYKDYATECAPGSSEKDTFAGVYTGQPAIAKYKTRRFRFAEPHVGCEITLPFAVNRTILKNCSGSAKNKINMPLDVTILIELAPGFCVQSVLPSEKAASEKNCAVCLHQQRDRLGSWA
jgi:hypothetical protein